MFLRTYNIFLKPKISIFERTLHVIYSLFIGLVIKFIF